MMFPKIQESCLVVINHRPVVALCRRPGPGLGLFAVWAVAGLAVSAAVLAAAWLGLIAF